MRLYEDQPSGTITRARELRRIASEAEKRLLRALRTTFPTLKWRHSVPFGPYYADILCFAAKLVIEVDGGQHGKAHAYDERRTRHMNAEGYRVLRFWNNDVLANTDGVIEAVTNSLPPREREGARPRASGDGKDEGDHPVDGNSPSPLRAFGAPPLPRRERGGGATA
ncbi:endonuclease domain-containing protein [uncultured Sphingomonas sp.]|uniref:endonuclease domain-containing protein n=1 Tax=uncultured Sphingomonas sp. TaxID=158754 RepID=UPI0035CB2FEE